VLVTAKLNIATRVLRTMKNKATTYAVTLADKTLGRFNEAIDNLISIYLTPLNLDTVIIPVIGC